MLEELVTKGMHYARRKAGKPVAAHDTPKAAAALAYYEAEGRTWERAAFIKARAAAGDIAAGERLLRELRPFVWRKHLDFAAIQDAHDMRLRIRDHKGLGGRLEIPGHNMKLGRGGIREIEFYAQTQQLILGGRDPELRERRTLDALEALSAAGHVPPEVVQALSSAYVELRGLEHRVQMLDDEQTHRLPQDAERRAAVAALAGKADLAAFDAAVPHQLGLKKKIGVVKGCREVQKTDLIHNGYLPNIEVDPQNYQVKADGQLLWCEPAEVLPMAQRYFLF